MKLYDKTFSVLEKSMDLAFKRHMVLSSNVANSETPNFRARDVDFAGELKKAAEGGTAEVGTSHPLHMDTSSNGEGHTVLDDSGAMGADGNNVDLDLAMGRLSENARSYSSAGTLIGVQLRLLKTAARGRGGA